MKTTKNELDEVKNEVEAIKQEGFALEIIKEHGKVDRNKNKWFAIIIVVLALCWFVTGAYLVYVLNDIGTIETTTETYDQDISDTGDINNSNVNNGGVINGKN